MIFTQYKLDKILFVHTLHILDGVVRTFWRHFSPAAPELKFTSTQIWKFNFRKQIVWKISRFAISLLESGLLEKKKNPKYACKYTLKTFKIWNKCVKIFKIYTKIFLNRQKYTLINFQFLLIFTRRHVFPLSINARERGNSN